MDDDAIDQAIFSMLSELAGWTKVAAVVGRVGDALVADLPDGNAAYETVAQRIEALVGEGRLVAQGNIKNWRFSEVRLPG
jgi:hypothetical protein